MSLHQFTVEDISGNSLDLSKLKGKKVMVVNTASECGLTPQYEQLEELYQNSDKDRFVILGFPANNFGAQEPGTNKQINTFCQKNYGVTFPMMSKVSVKGDDIHPLYKWLIEESKSKGEHEEVQWNFHKFLIDENGNFVKSVTPTVLPIDIDILTWIK